jgi:hypothetical protein
MSERVRPEHEREGVGAAALMMSIGALVLFWAPFFNGLVGGAIGGWRTGSPGRAFVAAVAATVGATGAFIVGYYFFQVSPKDLWFNAGLLPWAALTFAGFLTGGLTAGVSKQYQDTWEAVPLVPVRRHAGFLRRRRATVP